MDALQLTQNSSLKTAWRFIREYPVLPVLIIFILFIFVVFAPVIAPHDPITPSLWDRNDPPFWDVESSGKFLLGADPMGRDILSRIIHGARVSLTLAFASIATGVFIGTSLGLIAGYFGRQVDEIIMRLQDINAAIPYILVALIVIMVFGQSFLTLIGVLALGSWPGPSRLVRSQVLQLKEMDYVALARVSGASGFRIMHRHLIPGVINTVVVTATLSVGQVILAESILSFLGAGVPPPTPSWGAMVADGRQYLSSAWWVAFFPGMAVFITVVAFNFIGDWLRDRFDPRLRQL